MSQPDHTVCIHTPARCNGGGYDGCACGPYAAEDQPASPSPLDTGLEKLRRYQGGIALSAEEARSMLGAYDRLREALRHIAEATPSREDTVALAKAFVIVRGHAKEALDANG